MSVRGGRAGAAPFDVRLARSDDDRRAHHRVRHAVFVEEQGIFSGDDRDERDGGALHVVASIGPLVVGAVRLYRLDDAGLWQGDRLAVLPEARRLRVGAPLVRFAVATAGAHGGARMLARVQAANVPFFRHLGWTAVGDPADYRGLTHQMMEIGLAGATRVERTA